MTNIHLERSAIVIALVLLVICSFVGLLISEPAEAQSTALLWLNPNTAQAFRGGSTSVSIQLDSISNVYGAEVHLSYDPSVLAVVDANRELPGVQIGPGSCPAPGFVVTNRADSTAGTIDYAVTQLSPQTACAGGEVASIEFQCLIANTNSPVTIMSSFVSDPAGSPLAHTPQNGIVECLDDRFIVDGSVALQGWPNSVGTTVALFDDQGNPVGSPVTIGPDGSFSIMAPANGTTYSVVASHDRFLSVERTGVAGNAGDVISLGLATLPAGDLNGDGLVNILDITTVAGNFGKSGPQPWSP